MGARRIGAERLPTSYVFAAAVCRNLIVARRMKARLRATIQASRTVGPNR